MSSGLYKSLNEPFEDGSLLFHYTSSEVLLSHILQDYELRFSPMNNSHDPVEYYSITHIGATDVGYSRERSLDNTFRFRELSNSIQKNIKCCSFCIDKPFSKNKTSLLNKGWARPRMWAQYANAQTGVCIIFDKEKILHNIMKCYSKDKVFEGEIIYDNQLKELFKAKNYVDNELSNEWTFLQRIKEHEKGYLFNKLEDFVDEQEFRVAIYEEKDVFSYISIHDCIKGVIMGDKFLENNTLAVEYHSKRNSFELFEMRWYLGKPKINEFVSPFNYSISLEEV